MPAASWNVRVGLKNHEVVVDIDPESRKALIRVDGRMAARPMTSQEIEREFSVDSQPYILRRMEDGTFDLDIGMARMVEDGVVPRDTLRQPSAGAGKQTTEFNLKKVVFQAVIGLMILTAAAYGRKLYKHWSAEWHDYIPPDHTFKVSFPSQETVEQRTISSEGQNFDLTAVSAIHEDHEYGVAYFDLPGFVPEHEADPIFSAGINGMVSKRGGTIVKREKTVFARHYAQAFLASIPESENRPERSIRGSICINGTRIYIVMAVVPKGDAISYGVGQFLRSFTLPD